MSLKRTAYVAGKRPLGIKTQNDRFPSKGTLLLMTVCYKVSLCENSQRQSCKNLLTYLTVQK